MAAPMDPPLSPPLSPLPPIPTEAPSPPQQPPPSPEPPKGNQLRSFDEIAKEIKEMTPNLFDGFRLSINKPLSQSLQIGHILNLAGPPAGSSFKFSGTFVGGSDMEKPNTVLLGETDISGNTNGNAIFFPFTGSELRAQFQFQEKELQQLLFVAKQSISSYGVVNLQATNLNLIHSSYIGIANYLHRVSENLDLGFQYESGSSAMGKISSLSFGGRYHTPQWSVGCTLSPSAYLLPIKMASLSYYHKANENIQAGVEWECANIPQQESSTVSLCYKVDYPKANVSFKAVANTDWTVGSVLDKRIVEMGCTVSFSFFTSHAKNLAKLGVGFTLGGP